jgi:hypothetical protein
MSVIGYVIDYQGITGLGCLVASLLRQTSALKLRRD